MSVEKAIFVQNLFDGLAPHYDRLNQIISFGMHWRWKRLACKSLQLKPDDQVLDVCTGTGDNLKLLSEIVGPSGHVAGLDFSANMLALAQQRYATQGNIHLQQGDAQALPFEDGQFNGAIVSFGLRNVTSVQKTIEEMVRVVKPGGWVVNLDTAPNPKLPGYWLYFQKLMPLFGKLVAGNHAAYEYLANSTEQFMTPSRLAECFAAAGLSNVSVKPLAFGAVAIVAGRKRL